MCSINTSVHSFHSNLLSSSGTTLSTRTSSTAPVVLVTGALAGIGRATALAYCLRAAVKAGEIAPSTDCDEVAAFMLASLQGAMLLAKAQRSPVPVERFKEVLFGSVLQRIGQADPAG